ncbi:MAG: acetate/propionate family kinase [Phycisphaerae bacterium]|nr:acetate/propionate family kinase [Phycisphaerae bacterium]
MKVLVFNCGSSSLKYRLIEMPGEVELAGGEAQRVGPKTAEPARILHRVGGQAEIVTVDMGDHAAAFGEVMKLLNADARLRPEALGHRMVHGGTLFCDHAVVDQGVMGRLKKVADLAPLHNPPAINLLDASASLYPELPQTIVFDTAYHSTIPDYAYTYPIPKSLTAEMGLRKYGFHGTSHRYVAEEAAKFLGKPLERLNAVSCHLGSGGASLCAIVGGRSVDNTMGFSPLQGLMMSTRCGDVDAAVILHLLALADGDADAVERMLNKRSGVLGMSGVSADIRDVLARADEPGQDRRLRDTAQAYTWRIRKYLGSYLAVVGQADAVIFTDTIGETVPAVRWAVCADMEMFGLRIDAEANRGATSLPADVAEEDSAVRILAILTNEELAIARQTYAMVLNAA